MNRYRSAMQRAVWLVRASSTAFAAPIFAAETKTPAPTPFGAVPSERQLDWHGMERYGFIHFGINTFTDREWGYGDESPDLFNPTDFDADQIVGAMKEAGFRTVILTCKHHDGFCLWPTETTDHNVSASPYRNGQGDIVREVAEAAERAGLAFGVYLSPWDRNSPLYGTPEYVTQVYRPQLRELLTRYPNAVEVWFDGANGGDGYYGGARETRKIDRATYYDWPTTWQMVRDLAPKAVIFSDVGPGCRWVGNERGIAGDPCWATFTPTGPDGSEKYGPGMSNYDDAPTGTRFGRLWLPAEADVSIRPGWFWHASENDKVRSPENLMDLYLKSVGRGANLLLNVPPDRRGRVHENDVASLRTFGKHLDTTFAQNLAAGAQLEASHVRGGDPGRFGPEKLLDDDPWSAWTTGDFETTPHAVFTFSEPKRFNLVRLREDIRLGQRVGGAAIDVWRDGEWQTVAEAESIGACRLWRIDDITTDRVRLRVTKSPVCPALSDFGLFWAPPLSDQPTTEEARLDRSQWKVVSATGTDAENLFDGDPATLWTTPFSADGEPAQVTIDLGAETQFSGFAMLPRQDGERSGLINGFRFKTWGQAERQESTVAFGNTASNPIEQTTRGGSPVAGSNRVMPKVARYVQVMAVNVTGGDEATLAEFNLLPPIESVEHEE